MGDPREFFFPSADGEHQIHAVLWPAEGAPKAVVQIVHGLSEYVERYADFAAYLNSYGYTVIGHDHLGHGKTARGPEEYGCFPHIDGWQTVNRDVRQLRLWGESQWPGLPYFLLGHSMGSFQARTYLINYPGTVDGCILSGTGQESRAMVAMGGVLSGLLLKFQGPDHVSGLVTALTLGKYNRKFAPNRTTSVWVKRDPGAVDAYLADPLCRFVPTVGMAKAISEGLSFISDPANLARMDKETPIGLFSGGEDPVGGMGKGVEKVLTMFQDAGCRKVSMKLYPGARHEILNEVNRQEVYADFLAWLEKYCIT